MALGRVTSRKADPGGSTSRADGVLLVEQKSAGGNLTKAKTQALDYFPSLKEEELPRHVLLSDFQTFELYDLDEGTEAKFKLADLRKHVEKFGFILGVEKRTFRDQDPVNIKASELMAKLHDALKASGIVDMNSNNFWCAFSFACLPTTLASSSRGIFSRLSLKSERGKMEATLVSG